jgi:DNA-binding PadR family transcriptional regulator
MKVSRILRPVKAGMDAVKVSAGKHKPGSTSSPRKRTAPAHNPSGSRGSVAKRSTSRRAAEPLALKHSAAERLASRRPAPRHSTSLRPPSGHAAFKRVRPGHSIAKRLAPGNPSATHHELTTPDLVLLSLLAERPLHGYEANLELARRQVRDWAGISKPQIYYSLEKLARAGLIRPTNPSPHTHPNPGTSRARASARARRALAAARLPTADGAPAHASVADHAAGPERRVFSTTPQGRRALAAALDREDWTTHRDRPPFLTGLALSWQASPPSFRRQLLRRRTFLFRQLSLSRATLHSVLSEVGHAHHEAVWMLSLVIAQFRAELHWLGRVRREIPLRGKAKNPPKR